MINAEITYLSLKKKKETFKKGTMNQVVHYLENRDINITWKI